MQKNNHDNHANQKARYLSIENQSYSCLADEELDLSRVYVTIPELEMFKDDAGKTIIQLSSLLAPLRNAILDVLAATQGSHGGFQLMAKGDEIIATFDGGKEIIATQDPKAIAILKLIDIGNSDA